MTISDNRDVYMRGIYMFSLVALLCPSAALADGSGHVPSGDKLKIDIEATIAERCGIAAFGSKSKDGGRIDNLTSVSFNFRLDCNMPFRIGVAAQRGAIQLAYSRLRRKSPYGSVTHMS